MEATDVNHHVDASIARALGSGDVVPPCDLLSAGVPVVALLPETAADFPRAPELAREIAEDAGLDVPVLIKVLAKDGCRASDLRPEASWPIFGHFTVARLRASFGQDEDGSRALGAEAVGCFGEFVKTSSIGE